jgi:hypothetical protein
MQNDFPITGHIPCLYLKSIMNPSKIILAFHGNAEDLSLSAPFFSAVRNYLEISVLIVEYPGYGVYDNGCASAETIESDAEYIFKYLILKLRYRESDVLIFGRSIGSGPATYLASKFSPACLALMSPFTSLKEAARDYLGNFAKFCLKERFDNLRNMKKVKSPTFIVHG